jgi:hypothetical protein
MGRFIPLLALLTTLSGLAPAQQSSSLSADDAQSLGLNFSAAPGWQQGLADPYSATTNARAISIYFNTEIYSAAAPGSFDSKTTEDIVRSEAGDLASKVQLHNVMAASADGLEAEWPGSRIERWFRISNDRFLVERCMTNGVNSSVWTTVARPGCEAQFNAVVLTASTLPPAYRAAEPSPSDAAQSAAAIELHRIPGGHCRAASGSSSTARAASLTRHGEQADTPADQFACWEAASQLGSADAMTKLGQMFLERDQLHQSEQDRTAGVVWLLVAADRYHTLLRTTKDAEAKTRYQQRFNTIMDLVAALKNDKLSSQQFDMAVTEASKWKKSNMELFR